MEILKDKYSITELSERLQITDHTLRYYEKEFNILVPKDDRGRRFYTTELANLMYQIKNMRDEGLELKAIKKILLSENSIPESPPAITDNSIVSVVPLLKHNNAADFSEIKAFFEDFRDQMTVTVTNEISASRDQLSMELNKTKLELGACVENGMRKLEAKMERHFQDVDRSIGNWREKSNKSLFKRLFK